jgi:L-lysine epsilon oxidase C-terminal domain/L-Lysine epsilon oxidase N-terminal
VIGGAGIAAKTPAAGPIADYANNDGWFDDASDGPVTATLRLRVGAKTVSVPVSGAWVLVGPPDFAPDLAPTVTLWDLLLDLAVREVPLPNDEAVYQGGALARLAAMAKDLAGGKKSFTSYVPSFDEDVAPILRQALAARWVFDPAQNAHVTFGGGGSLAGIWALLSDPTKPNNVRDTIFRRVRAPGTPGLGADDMPQLLGDDPYDTFKTKRWGLSLTVTQYAILERWAKGKFAASALPAASLVAPPVPAAITPDGLDRAALERISGGAFFPGIEVGWQIREPALFAEPFRLKHGAPSRYVGDGGVTLGAGHFSRQMALPWLADFLQCKAEEQRVKKDDWGWWPSQRPDSVYRTAADAAAGAAMAHWVRATVGASADWPADPGEPTPRSPDMPSFAQMIANWHKLGVVVSGGGDFAEGERAGAVP